MIYFMGGANNDQDGWNYVRRFKDIFEDENIRPFHRLNFSSGRELDIWMTASASTSAWFNVNSFLNDVLPDTIMNIVPTRSLHNGAISYRSSNHLQRHYAENRQRERGVKQLNLMGYSYGSVLVAHMALIAADRDIDIDNLILIAAPIPSSSQLYVSINTNSHIKRVIRHDIPGDDLSNPNEWFVSGTYPDLITGAFQNLGDDGPHFDLARPDDPSTPDVDEGAEADARIRRLARHLYRLGVR